MLESAAKTSDTAESTALQHLLGEARGYAYEFIRKNADGTIDADICNHLELSLISAAELGATDQELVAFYESYVPRWALERRAAPRRPIEDHTWHLHLGDRRYEQDYRLFFARKVDELGWQAAVKTFLPRLALGPASSAFHSMIRLGYAVLRRDSAEVVEGLAYWSMSLLSLPRSAVEASFTDDPGVALETMRADERFHKLDHRGIGLWDRMNALGHESIFAPVVHWLNIGPDTLRKLAHVGLALYVEAQDMRALHVITGCQALRELLPYLAADQRVEATRCMWQAIASLYGLMGFIAPMPEQGLNDLRSLAVPEWAAISARARSSMDEHDLKLVFVLREEYRAYGDKLYQVAAARRMRMC
jgi:hypothetical protein